MGIATVIPQNTFENLELDAGALLYNFNPENPTINDSDIITATTGGIKIDVTPTYSDMGSDVDNCPENTKELKHLDSWAVSLSTTALNMSPDFVKFSLGAAESSGATYSASTDTTVQSGKTYYTRSGTSPNYVYTAVSSPTGNPSTSNYYELTAAGKITPRRSLKQSDFNTIWWVGDLPNGNLAVVKILNALSTGGFSFQSSKNSKGQTSLTITGHPSITAQDLVPVEYMVIKLED